ncbi:MAG: family 43 glycosylhydrolase, partial [Microthrixaceae bacterium]|nr:family 43 glycosylhydrolase [Microthrixaceae bacterium]
MPTSLFPSDGLTRPVAGEVDVDGPLSAPGDEAGAGSGGRAGGGGGPDSSRRRRLPVVLAALVLIVGAVAAARAYNDRAASQRRAEARLDEANGTVTGLEAQLADLRRADAELRAATEEARNSSELAQADSAEARAALDALEEQRQELQQQLVEADGYRGLQVLSNGRLKTCIDGLNRAVNQISVGDSAGGADTLGSVQDDCAAAEAIGPSEMPYDFPDPFVLVDGDTSYAYATNAGGGNVQLAASTDQENWAFVGDALPELPAWVEPNATWAPSVVKLDDSYVLYYSVRKKGQRIQCVSVAVASAPQGPFIDTSTGPLVCQEGEGGTIDPSPFVDLDGTPYLLYKSEGTPVGRSGALWSQQLNP